MPRRSPKSEPKRRVNVSIRSELLAAARRAGINLSATLERALIEHLETKRRKWREDNREAIAAYNEHVERHGVFSNGLRRW